MSFRSMICLVTVAFALVNLCPTTAAPIDSHVSIKEPFTFPEQGSLPVPPTPRWTESPYMPGDDMIKVQRSLFRSGIVNPIQRWPKNPQTGFYDFYYYITNDFSTAERKVITEALNKIHNYTAKLYVKSYVTTAKDYVYIKKGAAGTGCNSYVGRQTGGQIVNLEVSSTGYCVTPHIVLHELIHAVGFYHQHSRTDRDSYVEINWNNISPELFHNFNKYDNATVTSFGEVYDYGSVMGYSKYSFAKDVNVWTIRPKAPWQNYAYGPGDELSPNDIRKIDKMYP